MSGICLFHHFTDLSPLVRSVPLAFLASLVCRGFLEIGNERAKEAWVVRVAQALAQYLGRTASKV